MGRRDAARRFTAVQQPRLSTLFAPPLSRVRVLLILILLLASAPLVRAHGELEIIELETLIIRDFEGHEDKKCAVAGEIALK